MDEKLSELGSECDGVSQAASASEFGVECE